MALSAARSPSLTRPRQPLTSYQCRLPPVVSLSWPVLSVYLNAARPLSAVALVPSIMAVQPAPESARWRWLIVPRATPSAASYAAKFTCQGRPPACRVNVKRRGRPLVRTPGLVQRRKLTADREPAWKPGRPLPRLSLPLTVEEAQFRVWRVVVSERVNLPDAAWMPPPGCMVQVPEASAAGTPRVSARAAAPPAARMRAYRLPIAVSFSALRAEPGSPQALSSLAAMRQRGQA